MSSPDEYVEEAAFYQSQLVAACAHTPHTLFELGSGGGNNASHLKTRFQMALVDRSPGMLAVSRRLNFRQRVKNSSGFSMTRVQRQV